MGELRDVLVETSLEVRTGLKRDSGWLLGREGQQNNKQGQFGKPKQS